MYQQHSSYTSPQTPTYPYGSSQTANKPSHDAMTSPHHPLARPASMPPSYHQKYAASSAANDCYGFSADPKQSFGPPPPLERGNTHYDSPVPRAWQQHDPYNDTNGNASASSNTDELYTNGNDHLPTSLPAPMPYSHSNYFAPPPPSTPVPPSASAGGTILYGASNDRHHLYHPYSSTGSNRRHSASNPGYNCSAGGPLPSFALHHGASRHPLVPRPKLTTTLWEDEGTICYQVDANGICVARRHDNDMINGTKLLNVAGMSRGKRDGILKNEKGRVVVKVGAMHLKGVWITFARAKALATQFKILDVLHPLFVDNPSSYLYASPLHHHTSSNAGTRLEGGGFSSSATLRQGGLVGTSEAASSSPSQPVTSPHHHQSSSSYHPHAQGLRPIGEYPEPSPTTTGDMYNFDYRVNEQQQQQQQQQGTVNGGMAASSSFGNLSTYRLYSGGRSQNDPSSNNTNDTGGGHEGVNDNTPTNNSSGILNP